MKGKIQELKKEFENLVNNFGDDSTKSIMEFEGFHYRVFTLLDKIKNMAHIHKFPEGYKWCDQCDAVTPHKEGHSSWVENCVICGNGNYGSGCNNCGWTEPEPDHPEPMIKLHGPGCHCNMEMDNQGLFIDDWAEEVLVDFIKNQKGMKFTHASFSNPIRKYLKDIGLYDCSCPEVKIYRAPRIFNYTEQSVYSMDCSNAMEWSYDIRCPICGNVFSVHDGNC